MSRLAPADRALLFPAWAAADGLGQLTLLSMPFMLGMLVDNVGLSLADAGLLLSAELCTVSLVCMAISVFIGRLAKRTLAVFGAILAVVGNCISIWEHSFHSLLVGRAVAGVGYGMAMAAGNAVVATALAPAPLYDSKMVLFALTQLVVDVLVPYVSHQWGAAGCFGFMLAANLLMIPILLRLPNGRERGGRRADLSIRGTSLRRAVRGTASLIVAIAILFAVRESAFWGFLERFGAAAAVNAALVGLVAGIGAVPAVVAPKLATVCRARFGELVPIIVGVLLEGVVLYLLCSTTSRPLLLSLILIWPMFYCYTVPLLMGVAARLDGQGRVIALVAGSLQIAFAIGPAFAGSLVQKAGLRALGPFAAASTMLLMLLVICLFHRRLPFAHAVAQTEFRS